MSTRLFAMNTNSRYSAVGLHRLLLAALFLALQIFCAEAKPICYSGSSMYQLTIQDCSAKDPAYNGTWFCAKMEVCESFISEERQCVTTRGCATREECAYSASPTGYYQGNAVQLTKGVNPAGMTMTATCCPSSDFADDDTLAIDYNDICNSAHSGAVRSTALVIFAAALIALVQNNVLW